MDQSESLFDYEQNCLPGRKDPVNAHVPNDGTAPKDFLSKLDSLIGDGLFVKFGPFEVKPGMNQEVPIGRAYQPMAIGSVSRLQGFVGRDEYSLYIREVPLNPELGLRPSKNGIWVKLAGEEYFRRLEPGEAVRIYSDSEVRVGGNGKNGLSGLPIDVF